MTPFSVQKQITDDGLKFTIAGYIDEGSVFPRSVDFATKVTIDLQRAEGINSTGVKNWCFWMESLKAPIAIRLLNCPPIFINMFNSVMGTLPRNATVGSFFVPFIAVDGTSARGDILFVEGKEYTKNGSVHLPTVKDESNRQMEADVLNNYFNFLKK